MDENVSVHVPNCSAAQQILSRRAPGATPVAAPMRSATYLREHEWEVGLGILEDFDGVEWQTIEFWDLLADAAQQMSLTRDTAWCEWRRGETLHGIMRADLQLVAPDGGGRRTSVPGAGQLPMPATLRRNG
jgi:hypothetical protein